MSCFSNTTSVAVAEPDLAKHVNYNLGMVLGVDDFTQEFAYLSGRDQWMIRDLIGYGTVRGLKVGIEVDAIKGPRVIVEPGVALSPRGQMICVPAAQCAYLKNWVADHPVEVNTGVGSPPSKLKLYVALCYRDCPTDNVPIAGEPCRSEDKLMAASRLKDDFSLELRIKPPNQREEDAVRDFVDWLRQVGTSVQPSTPLTQFLDAIRNAALQWFTSPPSSPLSSPPSDFMSGSPPAFLNINPADNAEYLRAAFQLWVTELRPKWIARWHGCAPAHFPSDSEIDEDCVLLAELSVPVMPISPGQWTVADGSVLVNQLRRPYVIHLRMLQEWLLGGRPATGGSAASLSVKVTNLEGPVASLQLTDEECVVCDSTGGGIRLLLPLAAENNGRIVIVKRINAGTPQVQVFAGAGETVEGQASIILNAQGRFVQLVANQKRKTWHTLALN
jgi:hypothetical protein